MITAISLLPRYGSESKIACKPLSIKANRLGASLAYPNENPIPNLPRSSAAAFAQRDKITLPQEQEQVVDYMHTVTVGFCAVVTVLIGGCDTAPPKAVHLERAPEVPNGYANVYFMREYSDFGRAVWPAVLLNGQRAAPLPNGTFSVVSVKPGTYAVTMTKEQLTSGPWTGKTNITAQAGQNYYLKLELMHHGVSGMYVAGKVVGTEHEETSDGQKWVELDETSAMAEVRALPFVEPFNRRLPLD